MVKKIKAKIYSYDPSGDPFISVGNYKIDGKTVKRIYQSDNKTFFEVEQLWANFFQNVLNQNYAMSLDGVHNSYAYAKINMVICICVLHTIQIV